MEAKGGDEMKRKSLPCIIFISILIIFHVQLCIAQGETGLLIDTLASSSKLIESDLVLENFRAGSDTTRVIVSLSEPLALQHESKSESKNFRKLSFRTKLREAVQAFQDQVITRLDPTHVQITNRFSYIFGFSAEVTLEGLIQLERLEEVVSISTDMLLEAHLAQGIGLIEGAIVRNTYNGSGLAIAITDTGIDTSHPMLGDGGSPIFNSKVIGGYDTGDDDADPRPHPTAGEPHGTACAGLAAGDLGTVGDYIGGVAHNAKLYAVKISFGNGGTAWTSDMIEGWEWCITHQYDDPNNPIMIISTSFGGGRYTSNCDSAVPAMTTAAANTVAAGITLFVSSGNDTYTDAIEWPACISHVNSVGAVYDANVGYHGYSGCTDPTTASDQVTCYSNSASFLTLFAPSHDAYTADIVGSGGYSIGDYTPTFGGTSAASPYAAGAAASLQSAAMAIRGSFLTPAEVRSALTTTGDLVTDPKAPDITKPRINLQHAVDPITGPLGECGLLTEGFEDSVVPPADWTVIQTNPDETWTILAVNPHTGSYAANVASDPAAAAQDEVLLTPQLPMGWTTNLDFYSRGSLYWCRDWFDNCDLEVWIVVDDWDGGAVDDIYVGNADDDWTGDSVWSRTSIDLTPLLPALRVRLGFRYVGLTGAQIALDDIEIEICSDGHSLMILRQKPDGKFKLEVYDVPVGLGDDTGPPIASDNYMGASIKDIGAPRSYGVIDAVNGWIDGLAVLRQRPDSRFKLQIYDVPTMPGGNTGPPAAFDGSMGAWIEYIATGNFDSDPEDEIAILRKKSDANYKLQIYDIPTIPADNTGPPIAVDYNIGADIIAMAAANFDGDQRDELAILRLRPDDKIKLEIYDVPTVVGGDTGAPVASDNNMGIDILDFAAGNFDGDPENEIAVVRQRPDDSYKLQIYDVPTVVGGDTGPPVAIDYNIGEGIRAVCAFAR
jgi:hypothetical protein